MSINAQCDQDCMSLLLRYQPLLHSDSDDNNNNNADAPCAAGSIFSWLRSLRTSAAGSGSRPSPFLHSAAGDDLAALPSFLSDYPLDAARCITYAEDVCRHLSMLSCSPPQPLVLCNRGSLRRHRAHLQWFQRHRNPNALSHRFDQETLSLPFSRLIAAAPVLTLQVLSLYVKQASAAAAEGDSQGWGRAAPTQRQCIMGACALFALEWLFDEADLLVLVADASIKSLGVQALSLLQAAKEAVAACVDPSSCVAPPLWWDVALNLTVSYDVELRLTFMKADYEYEKGCGCWGLWLDGCLVDEGPCADGPAVRDVRRLGAGALSVILAASEGGATARKLRWMLAQSPLLGVVMALVFGGVPFDWVTQRLGSGSSAWLRQALQQYQALLRPLRRPAWELSQQCSPMNSSQLPPVRHSNSTCFLSCEMPSVDGALGVAAAAAEYPDISFCWDSTTETDLEMGSGSMVDMESFVHHN